MHGNMNVKNQKGVGKSNFMCEIHIICLRQYVSFCCLILRPATRGQFLDLQSSASERA